MGTKSAHHLCEGMHRVTVTGPAEIGQATGDGESPGVVRCQTQRLNGITHCHRETAVEIKKCDVIALAHGPLKGLAQGQSRRGCLANIRAQGYRRLAGGRLTVQIDAGFRGYPQFIGQAGGHNHQGSALVNLVPRHQALGVGAGY